MEKVTVHTARSGMVEQLKRAILRGTLPPGEELVQEELAAQMQGSRTPVREALLHLEEEGYVCRLPNRHVRVSDFDPAARRENLAMIRAIEQELLRLRREDSRWLPSLEAALADFRAAPSAQTETAVHRSFSADLENAYLQKLHLRVIDGHFRYLAECARPHEAAQTCLTQCAEALLTGRTEEGCALLQTYFEAFSDCI